MDFKTQDAQKALQAAVKASSVALEGEKQFTYRFAEACVKLGLNANLTDKTWAIPLWDGNNVNYATANKKLFRMLGLKEAGNNFNVEFVTTTFKAFIVAMPEKIALEYLNSEVDVTGYRVVSNKFCATDKCLDVVRLIDIKEGGEAIAALAGLSKNATPIEVNHVRQELLESIEARKAAISALKSNYPEYFIGAVS